MPFSVSSCRHRLRVSDNLLVGLVLVRANRHRRQDLLHRSPARALLGGAVGVRQRKRALQQHVERRDRRVVVDDAVGGLGLLALSK